MLRTVPFILILCALWVSTLTAGIVSKDGTTAVSNPPETRGASARDADFIFNSGGAVDLAPTAAGSRSGWGEWFVVTLQNTSGYVLSLTEFGFPCAGPATGDHGWVIWTGLEGLVAPAPGAGSARYFGSFTPADSDPTSSPPTTYTYVDLTHQGIIIEEDAFFCFGYENTGMGGQTEHNSIDTWAWYGGRWDPDANWNRTAVLQVAADFGGATAVDATTWGEIKSLYR